MKFLFALRYYTVIILQAWVCCEQGGAQPVYPTIYKIKEAVCSQGASTVPFLPCTFFNRKRIFANIYLECSWFRSFRFLILIFSAWFGIFFLFLFLFFVLWFSGRSFAILFRFLLLFRLFLLFLYRLWRFWSWSTTAAAAFYIFANLLTSVIYYKKSNGLSTAFMIKFCDVEDGCGIMRGMNMMTRVQFEPNWILIVYIFANIIRNVSNTLKESNNEYWLKSIPQ